MEHCSNGLHPVDAFFHKTKVGLDEPGHQLGKLVSFFQNGCLPGTENDADCLGDSMTDR